MILTVNFTPAMYRRIGVCRGLRPGPPQSGATPVRRSLPVAAGSVKATGFTLIEVLVALAVVAIAVVALATAGGRSLDTQYQIENRTLALWVADNRLAELALESSLQPGSRSGTSTLGGRSWRWRAQIQAAPGGMLWRVDIAVFDVRAPESDGPVFDHSGFLPR